MKSFFSNLALGALVVVGFAGCQQKIWLNNHKTAMSDFTQPENANPLIVS
jgi:hypothetical protein